MSRNIRITLILISLWTALGGIASADRTPARQNPIVATLLVTLGSATITSVEGSPQDIARDDTALVAVGDVIEISDNGEGFLTFFEGAETRLAAGTSVEVQAFSIEGSQTQISLSLVLGQVLNSVETAADAQSRFEVTTPAATITVRGTVFSVFVRPDQLTQVATLEGTVEVSAQGQTVEVPQGYGVRVVPGEAPGEVVVWGQAVLAVDAPMATVPALPVIFTNTTTGHVYHFRNDIVMMVALGSYDAVLNIPGPARLEDITFDTDTPAETPLELEVALGALIVNLVDSSGTVVHEQHRLLVRLEQDERAGETVVLPGEPILAGPGVWRVTVAPETEPERVQTVEVTIEGGALTTIGIDIERIR